MSFINLHKKKIEITLLVFLLILAFVSVAQGSLNAIMFSQDSMWPRVKAILSGVNPYNRNLIIDFYEIYGYENHFGTGVHYFPSVLYVMSPLALINNILLSKWILLILSLISSVVILVIFNEIFRFKKLDFEFIIIILVFFSGLPFRNSIGVGQNGLIAIAFILTAIKYKESQIISSIFFSLALIKYTITGLFALYFLKEKKYATLIVSAGLHFILHIFAMRNLNLSFVDLILQPLNSSSGLVSAGFADYFSNLGSGWLGLSLSLTTLLLTIFIVFTKKLSITQMINILAITTLLIVYHRMYDYFILLLVYPAIGNSQNKSQSLNRIVFYILLVYFFFFVRFLLIFDIENYIKLFSMFLLTAYYIYIAFLYSKKQYET